MLLSLPGVAAVAGCSQTGVDNLPVLRLVLMSPWISLAYVNYSLVYVHSMVSVSEPTLCAHNICIWLSENSSVATVVKAVALIPWRRRQWHWKRTAVLKSHHNKIVVYRKFQRVADHKCFKWPNPLLMVRLKGEGKWGTLEMLYFEVVKTQKTQHRMLIVFSSSFLCIFCVPLLKKENAALIFHKLGKQVFEYTL